jgi:S1-C subfamily serine protease
MEDVSGCSIFYHREYRSVVFAGKEIQWRRDVVMSTLSTFSEAFSGAVSKAEGGIVRVEARRRLPASGILWSEDGLVVTAHHVVQREQNIRVGFPSGDVLGAEFIGRDETTDLAVLQVQGDSLQPLIWSKEKEPRVGHLVLALGRPSAEIMATLGIISVSGKAWRTPAGGHLDRYLQTDVVMYPGFSGGALIDAQGEGIGLNSSALLRGVSMAAPWASIQRIVETLVEHGRVRRGYLGVGLQPVRLPESLAEEIGQSTGLLLLSVEADSPAERSGLVLGDVLIEMAGEAVTQVDDLLAVLSEQRVDQELPVRLLRAGKLEECQVKVGERR